MKNAHLGLAVAFILASSPGLAAVEPEYVQLTSDGYFKQRPAWSPDGQQLLLSRHQGSNIFLYVLEVHSGQQRRLTQRKDPEFDAAWSPDGKRVAFTFDKVSPNQGNLEVYTCDMKGENLQPLAVDGKALSHEESPAWSPDGEWIVYSSTRDGNQEIYLSRVGSTETRRLTSDPALDAHPAFSPDGKRIAFATNRWGDLEIATIETTGEKLTRVTHSPGLDDWPAWSVDGKRLAITSNRDRNFEIYVLDLATNTATNATRHAGIDNFPTWTPDGRLTFVSNRSGRFEIYVERTTH